MGWKLKKRDDIEPLLPLKRCFCFDNRMGTFIGCVIISLTAFVEVITVILDWLTYNENIKFEIQGSFRSFWKRLFWKGFVICDGIMVLAHVLVIAMCIYLIIVILRPRVYKIYDLLPALRGFYIIMIVYILVELGISLYIYSWYGLAGWRLPFLVWKNLFYIMRFLCNVGFCIVAYSYSCEIVDELADPDEAVQLKDDQHQQLQQQEAMMMMMGGQQQQQQQQQQFGFNSGNDYAPVGSYAGSDVYARA